MYSIPLAGRWAIRVELALARTWRSDSVRAVGRSKTPGECDDAVGEEHRDADEKAISQQQPVPRRVPLPGGNRSILHHTQSRFGLTVRRDGGDDVGAVSGGGA